MGAMSPAGRNPFGPVDAAAVFAALKAAGSFDPDVLFAAKQRMLAPYKDLKRLAVVGIVLGCALVVMISLPIFGILAFAASALLWRFQAKQVANVEAGYSQFLASGKS